MHGAGSFKENHYCPKTIVYSSWQGRQASIIQMKQLTLNMLLFEGSSPMGNTALRAYFPM